MRYQKVVEYPLKKIKPKTRSARLDIIKVRHKRFEEIRLELASSVSCVV